MTVANSAYERIAGEKYFTPAWVTLALLSVETFGRVWDPGAGAGNIVDAIPGAWGSDVEPDAPHIIERDFFTCQDGGGHDIITNPPYGTQSRLAVRFIERALALTQPHGGKVAMLLKVGFDSADGRRNLFETHPAFAVEYRLTKRIRWTNFEQKDSGPTENHSWFLWDWRKRLGTPAIKSYLPLKESAHAEA